ncbi:hypothetical protein, partial [Acetobacter pasteurianus]|uniref:hypothetical protein n=1 Tax=Acetobacter pasteurianus TaxID=438 RepID=UPI001BDFB5AE
ISPCVMDFLHYAMPFGASASANFPITAFAPCSFTPRQNAHMPAGVIFHRSSVSVSLANFSHEPSIERFERGP